MGQDDSQILDREWMRLLRGVAGWATFAALCAGIVCALSSGADAEQITLRLHTFSAPQAIANRVFIQPWAQAIEEKSGNRVEVQVFTAMQLGGKPSDLYGQARDGVVDIVWTLPGYSPGRFPLTEVFELPSVAGDAVATSQALTEFYRKWMRDEYKDTRPLVFHATARSHLHTAGKQIRTLEDFEGLKMRASSRTSAAMLRALGAIPVGMPVPDVYEALSRGVVDGAWIPWTIMRPLRLHEVTKYHTEVFLSCAVFVMTMNTQRYDQLPPDIRAIIDDSTGMALAKRLGRLWKDDEKPGRALAVKRGDPILSLSAVERARWEKATQPVVESWIERVSAMGYDGRALIAEARRLVAKYSD